MCSGKSSGGGFTVSSNSILTGGLISSSNCPFFTLHKKAAKKIAATVMLAISNMIITLIWFNYRL